MVHFFSQYIEKHRHPSRTILTGAGSCVKQHCDVGPSISLFATLLMNFCHLNAADVFEIFFITSTSSTDISIIVKICSFISTTVCTESMEFNTENKVI